MSAVAPVLPLPAARAEGQTLPVSDLDDLSAEDVRAALGLEPHPTCGYVALTYGSATSVAPGGLGPPFADGRPTGSALVFLVTAERPVHLHALANDQLYHRYAGHDLEVLLLLPDGRHEVAVVGPDLAAGHHLQLLIPGGTFHTARLRPGPAAPGRAPGWFLGGSTQWPGVLPADVTPGDPEELAARFPAARDFLAGFAGAGGRGAA